MGIASAGASLHLNVFEGRKGKMRTSRGKSTFNNALPVAGRWVHRPEYNVVADGYQQLFLGLGVAVLGSKEIGRIPQALRLVLKRGCQGTTRGGSWMHVRSVASRGLRFGVNRLDIGD